MTPEAFVEMVAPHLPIGPYTGIRYVPDSYRPSARHFTREIHLSRNDGHGSHFDTDDAARLIIGAVASVCPEVLIQRVLMDRWLCRIDGTSWSACVEGAGPPGALRAVLEAWEAYMTPIRPRPMMPNPDTEPKR